MKPEIEISKLGKFYWLGDHYHRDEIDPETGLSLPAMEYNDGEKVWRFHHKYHREDGPAIEYADGSTRYVIDDEIIYQLENKRIYGKERIAKILILL